MRARGACEGLTVGWPGMLANQGGAGEIGARGEGVFIFTKLGIHEIEGVQRIGETPPVPKTELALIQTTKVRPFLMTLISFIPKFPAKRS